jgi:hypothetical protein
MKIAFDRIQRNHAVRLRSTSTQSKIEFPKRELTLPLLLPTQLF